MDCADKFLWKLSSIFNNSQTVSQVIRNGQMDTQDTAKLTGTFLQTSHKKGAKKTNYNTQTGGFFLENH